MKGALEGKDLVGDQRRDADEDAEQGGEGKADREKGDGTREPQQDRGGCEGENRVDRRRIGQRPDGKAAREAAEHEGKGGAAEDQPLAIQPAQRIDDDKSEKQRRGAAP